MPTLAGSFPRSRSPSPPSSPPRMTSEDAKTLKMKSPEELLANPMADMLKNSPFLLPAQLMALNPQLYAAQFAQLQAAQLMLAKQTLENSQVQENGDSNGRKRGGEDLEPETKHKQPRSSSPKAGAPLDLSGSRSPPGDGLAASPMFNPMMQAGLLNFFNQLRPGLGAGQGGAVSRSPPSPGPPTPGRHSSPWQAQWQTKNSDTIAELSKHMREAKQGPGFPGMPGLRPPVSSPVRPSMPMSSPTLSSPPRHDRDILREQMPIPRKLVRGQDVWIGRADEQTRDILKCMGCGESFRTLDLLTKHMQATQHYKKVISHDQISMSRYSDPPAQAAKSPVASVLSCKVCDKGFGSLKELSDHMVRNNHYAGAGPGDPRMARAAPAPPPAMAPSAASRDRKKSLPVKKLLELERARQEVSGNKSEAATREIMETGKLMCERCEEKIPIDIFIPHIQQCVGRPRFLKANQASERGEAASGGSGNKDSKAGSKSESKEGGSNSDGSSSILGSLEQLVKGNFTSSASASASPASKILPPISSPVSAFPPPPAQASPLGKFNINNLFPLSTARSVSPPSSPSSSSHNSKPGSPNTNNTNNNLLQPSLEKMLDSPIDAGRSPVNGASTRETEERQSPDSERSGASPRPDDNQDAHIPQVAPGNGRDSADRAENNSSSQESAKPAGNALASLMSFCDDQTKSSKRGQNKESASVASSVSGAASVAAGSPMSDPGAILAFSWAVNQAANTAGAAGGDGAIKCPFCDTPFISRGAYRHHLSKMHFTKENLGNISSPNIPQIGDRAVNKSGLGAPPGSTNRTPSPEAKDAEESLQSKYQKYSQLAKQLSCYDGTN